MKIKKIAKIVLMTIFFIILGTKVYATTGIIKDKTVKLRKEPDSKTVLDYVYEGDKVEILEQQEGWYKVKATTELGKVTGYVSEKELNVENENSNTTEQVPEETQPVVEPTETPVDTTELPEETTSAVSPEITENIEENNEYILNQEVSVKVLPLINSIEKAKVSGTIKIIEKINDWTRIESDLENGWIRTNLLEKSITKPEIPQQQEPEQEAEEVPQEEIIPEEPEEPEQTEIKLNKTGYVSTDGLRVRKGPSTDTEEITSLSKNDEVQIIAQEGKWYKIDINGEIGYVSAKYISDTKVPETTSRSGSTLRDEKQEDSEQPKQENNQEETPVQENTSTNTTGAAIVEYAKQYLGYKYVSGGASPSTGFDCSGFTTYVYKHFGISLNRTSSAQINNGVAVDRNNLQPGDLVVFNNDANTKIGHVGIYIGDGNFIHASNPKDGVKITTLLSGYYKIRYVGARRVI